MIRLGVNIDHVATLRQARRAAEPDPVEAAFLALKAGADGITVHLREDRRHIQDRDVELLRQTVTTRLNLEMALADEIVEIALRLKPEQATLVPEKREEITTEGGLDVAGAPERTRTAVTTLQQAGIDVSLFVDAEARQVEAAAATGARFIEIHTGPYAHAYARESARIKELARIAAEVARARATGLRVNAGHGLDYVNVAPIAAMAGIEELNIGHSIVSRAVRTGMGEAVREMKRLMVEARRASAAGMEE